jgi:threonine dehydrogenase-like Zn-dependent dehydrogenase
MSNVGIVFTAKEHAELQSYEDPPLPNHHVRGRTLTSLISLGTETAVFKGDLQNVKYPIYPGYGSVFEVEAFGSEVEGFKLGDRLFCMGRHSSTQQLNARATLPVPQGMSAETAVIARLMGVPMTTLMTTAARPGEQVVVCGTGPVGYLAAHMFRISGYEVAVVEPDARRRQTAAATGLSPTYETIPLNDPNIAGKVALVLDCSGHEQAVLDGCKVVRMRGEVVLIATPWRRLSEIYAQEVLHAVFMRIVLLRSGWEHEIPLYPHEYPANTPALELVEDPHAHYNNARFDIFSGFTTALKWLEQGKIPLEGVVRTLTPENPNELYHAIMQREFEEPLLVLDWTKL